MKIDKIKDEISEEKISATTDYLIKKEKIKIERMSAEKDKKIQEVLRLKSERKLRLIFAKKIFGFVKCYIICILIIFTGYQFFVQTHLEPNFPVSPINTLIGSTTVIVVGLLATVIRYLFPNHKK